MFKALFNTIKAKAASVRSTTQNVVLYSLLGRITPYKALNQYHGWVFACVRAIADDVSAISWQLWKSGKERDERVWEHPLINLLDRPNPIHTDRELRFLISSHLDLTGNAYVLMTDENNEPITPHAMPQRLWVVSPSAVQVQYAQRGVVREPVGYAIKIENGKEIQIEPHAIIHFTMPSPIDELTGLGVVEGIAEWLDFANLVDTYNRAFFQNGATPSGVITGERIVNEEQVRIIREQIEDAYSGASKAHKVLVLPNGLGYTPVAFSNRDIEMAERQREVRDKILAAFRVPRTVLGITEDVNRANAEATNYVFALRAVKPRLETITRALNERLVPLFGGDLYLLYDDPVPENREMRIMEMRAAVAGQAVMSINEAREEFFGLPPIEGGDTVMGDAMSVPIGAPTQRKQQRRFVVRTTRHDTEEAQKKHITEKIVEELKKALKETEEEEVRWKEFVSRVEHHIPPLQGAIRKFNGLVFADITKKINEQSKSQRQKIALDIKDIFNHAKWTAVFITLIQPLAEELFGDEGVAAATAAGLSLTRDQLLTPQVKRALEYMVGRLAKEYNRTTAKRLTQILEEAQEGQYDLHKLTERVSELHEFSDYIRAEMVAKTEAFRLGNAARVEVWKEMGVVKSKRWYTAADERVCPYCRKMHGKKIEISETFLKQGQKLHDEDGGEMVVNYDDVAFPPLHPACRCYVVPEDINV